MVVIEFLSIELILGGFARLVFSLAMPLWRTRMSIWASEAMGGGYVCICNL